MKSRLGPSLVFALALPLGAAGQHASTTSLAVSAASVSSRETVTLTATVSPAAAGPNSEGFRFLVTTPGGAERTLATVPAAAGSGTASFTAGPFPPGNYSFQAVFLGNVRPPQAYASSSSGAVGVAVSPAGTTP